MLKHVPHYAKMLQGALHQCMFQNKECLSTAQVISALGFQVSDASPSVKGNAVLHVRQMPLRRFATDELKMSVTRVKQAKPHTADI